MGWPKGVPRKTATAAMESGSQEVNQFAGLKDLKIIAGGEREGWISVPVTEELPFDDNSVSEMVFDNQMQFVVDLKALMNEVFRVLKLNGTVAITVPMYPHKFCFQDPMTIRHFTDLTFHYFYEASPFWYEQGKKYGFQPFKALTQNVNGPYLTAVLRK